MITRDNIRKIGNMLSALKKDGIIRLGEKKKWEKLLPIHLLMFKLQIIRNNKND